jgi:transposase InsO family protein
MKRDIRNYIKKCHQCQTTSQKTDKSLRTPLNPLPPAVKANERVHMDLLGPLKTHRASKYILVMTDAFSKFVVLDTIKEKTAQAVAKAFFTKWIATFSTPDFLITDNGREFDNNLIRILTNEFEIGHIKTTSYHPQTNSQCERFNRTLLGYLRNYVDRDTLDWEDKLKYAQISYNTQIHSSTGQCPHFLMFLEDPQLPFSILTKPTTDDAWPQTDLNRLHKIYKDVAEKLGNSVDQMRQYYDRRTARKEFKKGDLVLKLRQTYGPEENKKLLPIWTGPYVVTNVNRETKNVRMMDKPGGRESAATFDQVIHYHARAPYDYKKGFLGRSGNGKTREIGTQTDQPDLEHGPRIIDGGRIHESGPPLDPGPGPSGPGPAPIPGNEDDSGRFSQSQDTTDDPPTNNEPLPGPSGLRTPPDLETGPEADPTTTETSEDDDNYSVASDSLSLTSQDPTDAERPTTTSPEAETVSEDEEPRSSPSTDPEITFNLPKPRTPTSAMKKKVFYKDYQMDASFDLNPRSLAERLRTEGITGKTLIGSEVYKKESMLHAATRRITTFATGREAKPQHFCRVFYEDRGEPMETDDMDTEMDIDQTIENNDIASNAPPANTKARNKKDKISLTQKTLTRGKNLIAEKQSRKQIKDKLLETIPHKRSGMRTRSHGEADNLQLTDQLLRELRKKKKLAN